jgi:hypothetical protein
LDLTGDPSTNSNLHYWDQTLSGAPAVPSAMGNSPKGLTQVELTIERGGRPYKFNFVFSGVGVRYGL